MATKSELYRPTQRNPKTGEQYQSAVWWMTYWVRGKRRRESTGQTDEQAAGVVLQKKKLAIAEQASYSALPGRAPISHLLDLLLKDYKRKENVSTHDAECKVEAQLRPFFTMNASELTSEDIEEYQDKRLDDGVKPASVNRELALLRRAYNLGARRSPPLVLHVPYFPMLKEDNAREGFLDWAFYRVMLEALPERVRLLFVLAFHVGARKGELLDLKWTQVDFARGELMLKRTKNGKPRTLPFYGEMREWLEEAWKTRAPGAALLFTGEDGAELGQFRKSWQTARVKAGVPDLLFHDLRRTAVRNMMDAGLSEHEAMTISGHLTDSMFRRYDIIDSRRLAVSGRKLDAHFRERLRAPEPKPARLAIVARKEQKGA